MRAPVSKLATVAQAQVIYPALDRAVIAVVAGDACAEDVETAPPQFGYQFRAIRAARDTVQLLARSGAGLQCRERAQMSGVVTSGKSGAGTRQDYCMIGSECNECACFAVEGVGRFFHFALPAAVNCWSASAGQSKRPDGSFVGVNPK